MIEETLYGSTVNLKKSIEGSLEIWDASKLANTLIEHLHRAMESNKYC